MCLLFETIRIENSKTCNIKYHNERLNRSRRELFGSKELIDLENFIIIPQNIKSQVTRCRVSYGREIRKIEFFPYQPRKIKSLKLIECNNIDYSFKYEERSELNKLFDQRGDADDILIFKDGYITDTSIANIVFFDGRKWITPSSPLLPGTQRAKLLNEDIIGEKEIKVNDLKHFDKAILINAMVGFKIGNYIDIDNIYF